MRVKVAPPFPSMEKKQILRPLFPHSSHHAIKTICRNVAIHPHPFLKDSIVREAPDGLRTRMVLVPQLFARPYVRLDSMNNQRVR